MNDSFTLEGDEGALLVSPETVVLKPLPPFGRLVNLPFLPAGSEAERSCGALLESAPVAVSGRRCCWPMLPDVDGRMVPELDGRMPAPLDVDGRSTGAVAASVDIPGFFETS